MVAINPKIRLFVEASLQKGSLVELNRDQIHYLAQVMRIKTGDYLALFNGRDGEWIARVQDVQRKSVAVALELQRRPQSSVPDIWFLFAPIKHGRIDFLAQKATELGAARIWPIMTKRTVVTRVKDARLEANAIEAAEQCERLEIPEVLEPVNLAELLSEWPVDRVLLYGDETGGGKPPTELFAELPHAQKWAVLVGPEGGFTPEELAVLAKQPMAYGISLGPRVMRADTAGLALLTCLQAWRGDWQQKPSFRGQEE